MSYNGVCVQEPEKNASDTDTDPDSDPDSFSSHSSSSPFVNSSLWFTRLTRHQTRREILRLHLSSSSAAVGEVETTEKGEIERVVSTFWFICLNRVEKITPEVFSDWMTILIRTSPAPTSTDSTGSTSTRAGSVLVLFSQSPEVDRQLQVRLVVVVSVWPSSCPSMYLRDSLCI